MTIPDILSSTEHRPWDIPTDNWKFYQEWNKAIFLHWEVDLSDLEKHVPKALEIDLYNEKAWVSVVAFTMEKIRPKYLPPFPPISNFHEINIRTYVKLNNKPGVYFISIEGGTDLSCKISKALSELPYRFSKIERTKNQYKSYNSKFKDELDIQFTIGKKMTEKTELDKWLTERYALFQDTENSINEFEIHHLEWPMNEIDLKKVSLNYQRFDKLIKNPPNKAQYSKGVKVIAWGKSKMKKSHL